MTREVNRLGGSLVSAAAFVLALTACPTATDLQAMTTAEAAKRARRIVVAECITVSVRELDWGQIFTFTAFDALDPEPDRDQRVD